MISESDATHLTAMISRERLAPWLIVAHEPGAAIELHQDIMRLGATLMPVTATIEIALRNLACDCLTEYFGAPDWLLRPPAPFQWRRSENDKIAQALSAARRSEYAKKSQPAKHALDVLAFPRGRPSTISHSQRAKKRQAKIQVTEGQVIAELTLYFWKKMYSPDYEQSLWNTSLKRTFPDKSLRRSDVSPHLETIYQTRNRLAHHEPVFGKRLTQTLQAVEFVLDNLGPSDNDGERSLRRLLQPDLEKLREHHRMIHDHIETYRR